MVNVRRDQEHPRRIQSGRKRERADARAAVAVARKLAVLCWHLLTKDADYQWARPALVAHKIRAMQLQAGQPEKKGNKRGAAYAYNIKELRDREIDVARHAEHAYEQFVGRWQPRGLGKRRTGAANEERR
jgi:transposase